MLNYISIKNYEQCEELYKLAVEINRDHYADITGVEQVDYMMKKFMSPSVSMEKIGKGSSYFFVNDNGENAGYFCLDYNGEEVFLSKLYLKKNVRGKGFARQIFEEIKDLSRKAKAKYITLTVNRGNVNSIAVYKKLGFYVYKEAVTDIGGGYVMDDYFMKYDL